MARRRSNYRRSRARASTGYATASRNYRTRRRPRRQRSWLRKIRLGRLLRPLQVPFVIALALLAVLALSVYWVHRSAEGRIFSEVSSAPECRAALVLGAKVSPTGHLSHLLRLRVDTAIKLYKAGKVDKLLMSGDNRFSHYNEPQRMADYAVRHGVLKSDIAMDFAGRRTYDSVYRAKHIFGLNRILVVTQGFHLDRALFLCGKLGLEAYGVEAPMVSNTRACIREYPACVGAIFDAYIRHPVPIMGKKEDI